MKVNYEDISIDLSENVSVTVVNADKTKEMSQSEIVMEHTVDVIINDILAKRIVCTPTDIDCLVIGRLVSEGYIADDKDVEEVTVCNGMTRVKVVLNKEIGCYREIETEPTYGTGSKTFVKVKREMKPVKMASYEPEWIFELANAFSKGSVIHKKTKGAHCCYLSYEGRLVYSAEDVGRHNALDKAIGYCVKNKLDRNKCILYTTGRVPTDMVEKAVMSGVPILVSKAVPTDKALEMARKYNLTLICKAWPDKYEIFCESKN